MALNNQISRSSILGSYFRQYCKLDRGGERLLVQATQRFGLSARAHDRMRKVARTIADLAGADAIGIEHLSEVVQYRTPDRQVGY